MPHPSQKTPLFSIGYGNRPWAEFRKRLCRHQIEFLVDVRSRPTSRQSEFNSGALRALLHAEQIRYLFLGDALGGRPSDPDCYVDGHVDYSICRQKPFFQEGLERLAKASDGGFRVALMCSELDPERCHRSKMIGEALSERGIPIEHIDRDGTLVSQRQVIDRLTGGQETFSFERGFRSVGRYAPSGGRFA